MRKYLHAIDAQKGQALLLVVLVMVIALTVGVSAVTRSVTNVRISTDNENSQRAYAAAEAGIQQALTSGTSNLSFIGNGANANATTSTTNLQGKDILVNNGNAVSADQGTDVWLVDHDAAGNPIFTPPFWHGNLTIYWGNSSSACAEAAIEVIILSGASVGTAVSNHYVADLCGNGRSGSSGNNFGSAQASATTNSIGSQTFYYQLKIPAVNAAMLMRVIPLYANSPIGIHSNKVLPQQGTLITSIGSAEGGAVQRKLVYFQGYPTLPAELFQYIYFVNPN